MYSSDGKLERVFSKPCFETVFLFNFSHDVKTFGSYKDVESALNKYCAYIFATTLACISLAHAGTTKIQCKNSNKEPIFNFIINNDLFPKYEDEEQSFLFNFFNANKERVILVLHGMHGGSGITLIPDNNKFFINTNLGPAYFIRMFGGAIYYMEGKSSDGASAWQLFNKKYIEQHLFTSVTGDALKGQFYPGKRFGPLTLTDLRSKNTPNLDYIFFRKDYKTPDGKEDRTLAGTALEVSCQVDESTTDIDTPVHSSDLKTDRLIR
ncbi:MAG: hypothetical protein K0R14_106 [Burkholderiales bacterium]|nr:hypothetical protein [Burkholderiales bacterium]